VVGCEGRWKKVKERSWDEEEGEGNKKKKKTKR